MLFDFVMHVPILVIYVGGGGGAVFHTEVGAPWDFPPTPIPEVSTDCTLFLVMMFKRQRRANTAMPVNTGMQMCTYGNMAEGELRGDYT